MTTLRINLSAQLEAELSRYHLLDVPGVNLYAVYFDAGGTAHWTTIVSDAGVPSPVSIDLPQPYNGGKVYILLQSVDTPSASNDLPTQITQQSQINWNNAQALDFRYDSFEVTLNNASGDAGNLTSVNGFGMPMQLSVTTSTGTTSTAGYNIPAYTGTPVPSIFGDIANIDPSKTYVYPFSQGPLSGQPQMALSPTVSVGGGIQNAPFQTSDWNSYIQSLETNAGTPIKLGGFFNGAPDGNGIWHNAGFYSYTLSWDATEQAFWLSPDTNSQIKGYIKIDPTNLANSIYSTLGNVEIYTNPSDKTPYTIFQSGSTEINSGANNQWGDILAQFLTGFTAGFYNVSGQSLNSGITTPINLNSNWNWDPTYAFGAHLSGGATPTYMDPYSQIFFQNSNSYGSGYSDALMQHYSQGGPLMSMWDPGTGTDVSTINLTLYADGETPAGYTPPVIYNYIAPTAGTPTNPAYTVPTVQNTGSNIVLSFSNQGMILDPAATVTLNIMTGGTAADPTWTSVAISGSTSQPLFQNWSLSYDAATNTYSAAASGVSQPAGTMLIANLPTADSGVVWYQIVVSDHGASKTFNLYTTMSGGAFLNPAYSGQEGSIAVDGLALPSLPALSTQTINTFTLGFLYSTTTTLDPTMLVPNTSSAYTSALPIPDAPVAGAISAGVFTSLAGQTSPVSNSISPNQSEFAFGWTGTNSNSTGWLNVYTNQIGAQHTALISFAGGSAYVAPVAIHADIDGMWQARAMTQLGNGTYTVTMQEYAASDINHTTPLGPQSQPLTLNIALLELALAPTPSGTAIQFGPPVNGPIGGNWINFQTLSASVPAGMTLMLYATDANGNLVSRDDHHSGSDVTLASATLGRIGAVTSDHGASLLLSGSQSVYLPFGEQLHFAVVNGNQVVDTNPDVQLTSHADGSMDITVAGLQLKAVTDNTLTDAATLASTQRSTDQPLVYLHQGDTISVEVAGSSANTNTVGFVHMDIDGSTGAASVGGIAYGDTDAFYQAVLNHLDTGLHAQNGGQFDTTLTWTVGGPGGYYAPVMLTQNGDVFVIGTANSDGNAHIRMYGENTFGFEDLTASRGSDFDYNDMVVKLTPLPHIA